MMEKIIGDRLQSNVDANILPNFSEMKTKINVNTFS